MDRIGDQIERELARSGSRDAIPLTAITASWPDVAGDAVARNAWPLRLGRDGTLHVATSSSTWAHELDLLQEPLLDGLRAKLGESAPTRLRFAAGPVPEPPSPREPSTAAPSAPAPVPPEIESEAAAAASEIDDEELRALVARAARASLLKARSGRQFW
jgi:predicted nucleic acid-binding Zn ribbon protein